MNDKLKIIKEHIDCYPDFPKPGIIFRDIFSVLKKPKVFALLNEVLLERATNITPKIDCVVALDARGFLFGPQIALELQVPFVPIRKKGKLPGCLKTTVYAKEYGQDECQMQNGCIKKNNRVLVIDDLLATGGSLEAACRLIDDCEAEVVECLVIMELTDLKGRNKIKAPVHSLIQYS